MQNSHKAKQFPICSEKVTIQRGLIGTVRKIFLRLAASLRYAARRKWNWGIACP